MEMIPARIPSEPTRSIMLLKLSTKPATVSTNKAILGPVRMSAESSQQLLRNEH
jgi:hypothetical protein